MRPELAAQTISPASLFGRCCLSRRWAACCLLMQLQIRAASRQDAAGALVRLEDQERALYGTVPP